MDDYQIIAGRFQGTIENIAMSVDSLATPISRAGQLMTETLLQDGKIVCCGNGVDTAQAQLFTTAMQFALEVERPALPAIVLGGDGAGLTAAMDTGRDPYAPLLQALGQAGDTLLVINSGEAGSALAAAVSVAHDRNMRVVALSNLADTSLPGLLRDSDELVLAQASARPGVVELHTMILLCFCQLIEHRLFGGYPGDNS